jgi:hypothetical protein
VKTIAYRSRGKSLGKPMALGMLLMLPACVTEGVTDQAYSALRNSGVFEQVVSGPVSTPWPTTSRPAMPKL